MSPSLLLAFLLVAAIGAAAGFLAGRKRARKQGPIDQMMIEIKADTSQAIAALDELQKKADSVMVNVHIKGNEVANALKAHNYRQYRTA